MRDAASSHFVGLDIGTSIVRCVVGIIDPESPNQPSIIGHGSAANLGVRKGVVVQTDDVAQAVIQAVNEAERLSGRQIRAATVNVNGTHITGQNSRGVIAVSTGNREISEEDRARVEEAASIVKLPANREIVQVFAKNYSVDGQHNIKNPVGMQGVRLEVDTHIVTAATPNMRNLDLALEKARLAPAHYVVSSLAGAEAVLSRQQKEVGTVLVDIGAGTTNLVIIEDGEVQHVAVLPMGGVNITNDLAIGLKTDWEVAEQVKLQYGHFLARGKVRLGSGAAEQLFDTEEVKMIAEARVEEIFEYVDKELQKIHRSRKLPGGVVIIGGTAKIPMIAAIAKDKLELSARIGKLHGITGLADTVEDPAWYTATGLMLLDMLLEGQESSVPQAAARRTLSFVDNLWRRFR